MKKFFAVILASAMVLSLAACGSTAANATTQAAGTTAEVAGEAKLSGKLVIYSSAPEADNNSIIQGFGANHPDIQIEFVQGNQGEGIARVKAEAGNPTIDVFYTGINDSDGQTYKDLFEPYVSPYNSDLAEMYQSNGFYNYNMVSTTCICVNTDLEKELGIEINGYEDLTDPLLNGKFVFSDPTASSAAWNNICTIMANYGYDSEKSWDLIDRLLANGMKVTESSSVCFNSVQTGEYVAGITYEGGPINLLADGAENIKIVYPEEGTGGSLFASAVIKGAKNMDNAKALVDWLTSREGQQAQLDFGSPQRHIAKDLDFSNSIVPALEKELVARDVAWLVENKKALLEKWSALYAKYNK